MNPAFAIIVIIAAVGIWFFAKKIYWIVGEKASKAAEDFMSEMNDFDVNTSVKDKEEDRK